MRIALPPAISPAAFANRDPAAAVIDLAGASMGTTWSVRYVSTGDPAGIRAAIEGRLAGLVAVMSHWAPASLLSRFNRAVAGTWTVLPPDFAHVMARGLDIAAVTDGAFDPAIGRLVNVWGFGPVAVGGPPDDAAIEAACSTSGWQRLVSVGASSQITALPRRRPGSSCETAEIARCDPLPRPSRLDPGLRRGSASEMLRISFRTTATYLRQPGGLALDLSGIAKGHAVDAIADLLHARDIYHCLVEIGGELVGRGIRPDGEPWWVDLEAPPGVVLPPLRIALHDIAVATSGDYRRGAHTLDPRTGRPITSGVVSASVIHATALDADAWATALSVLGVVDGMALAEAEGIAARLVTVIDGGVREHLTPALVAMLHD